MSYVFVLMLVIVVLALHPNEIQSQANPGFQSCITQAALDLASVELTNKFHDIVQDITFPDAGDEASILHGILEYEITNKKVASSTKPSTSTQLSAAGVKWILYSGGVTIEGDWNYVHRQWKATFTHSGSLTCKVRYAAIIVKMSLGLDTTGNPTLSSTGCSCSISSISITFDGGVDWINSALRELTERAIVAETQWLLCRAAKDVVNGMARFSVNEFPLQLTVATNWLLDYRLLSAPSTRLGYLYTRHKGTFYHQDKLIDPPMQAKPLPTTTNFNKMVTLWMSDNVLNTVGYAIFTRNLLIYNLTNSDLPGNMKSYLSTTCSTQDSCLGNIFPEISSNYPNSSVEVEMVVTKAPITNISISQIQITFIGDVICRIKHSNVEVLKFSVELNAFVNATVDKMVLKGNVTRLTPTVQVINSSLISLSSDALSQAVETLGNSILLPFLNKKCEEGIPIPFPSSTFQFRNLKMDMLDHCLRITTDIKRVKMNTG